MYLNDGKICRIVKDEYVKSLIKQHVDLSSKKDSTGFAIVALEKNNMCFIVNENFNDKQSMIKRVAKYALEGYKVITNEDNRRNKS